jgi:hypothetical protein
VNEVASTLPNLTTVTPMNPVPVITTVSPLPAVVGEKDVITGATKIVALIAVRDELKQPAAIFLVSA